MNAKIIDWKKLSKTEGYKKLKNSLLDHGKHHNDSYKKVFGYLKSICYKNNLDPCMVLDVWEKDRTYSFPNYYQDYNRDKLLKLALTTIVG